MLQKFFSRLKKPRKIILNSITSTRSRDLVSKALVASAAMKVEADGIRTLTEIK
jgi:hypothetical protein